MAKNISDYLGKNFDLNNIVPADGRSPYLDSLNHNLFNRFLTKPEFDRIVGFIGDNLPSDINNFQIVETSEFDQTNQLQPMPTSNVGSEDVHLSFKNLLTRLELMGVDLDKYNEWGNSLQFNWVPPIDLDKIINYRNYYWDTTNTTASPQYLTIKNLTNWSANRYLQAKKSIVDVSISYESAGNPSGYLTIVGNVVNKFTKTTHVIAHNGSNFDLYQIVSISFNSGTGNTHITTVEPITSSYTVVCPVQLIIDTLDVDNNSITLSNDVTGLFKEGYIFSLEGLISGVTFLASTLSSTYDESLNETTIIINEAIDDLYSVVSMYPVLNIIQSEGKFYADRDTSVEPIQAWNINRLGDLIWFSNFNVITNGVLGYTSPFAPNLYDDSIDFSVNGVQQGDYLKIKTGKHTGTHRIISVSPNALGILVNSNLFTDTGIQYTVFRKADLDDLISLTQPSSPVLNDLWIDSSDYTVYQYNGATFQTVIKNFNLLTEITNDKHNVEYFTNNIWTQQNSWKHVSQLIDLNGKIKAQLPIIEYSPFIKLIESSYSHQEWFYRSNDISSFSENDNEPLLMELLDIRNTISFDAFIITEPNKIQLNNTYGYLVNELIDNEIVLSGFDNNSGTYTVIDAEYIQPSVGQRYVTQITLDRNVINVLDAPVDATIKLRYTSLGHEFINSEIHWKFEGINDITPSSISLTKNPMLDVFVSSSISGDSERNLGLYWEEISYKTQDHDGLLILLDSSLHDLVLIDDYQEGDIRVYINNVRQYGTFIELPSITTPDYVGYIQFNNDFTVTHNDVVRVELGEYNLSDIGRRSVTLQSSSDTELVNLTRNRKIEQIKTEVNQYPIFCIYDVNKNELKSGSKIFYFQEDTAYSVNTTLLRRIVVTDSGTNYGFSQDLLGEDNQLFCYYDYSDEPSPYKTIWVVGDNKEQFVPAKNDEDEWKFPNQLYYNVHHENKLNVTYREILKHFTSIISAQDAVGIFSKTSNLYYLDDNINYGLGGTIKEHNDGFDTLISAMFVKNSTPKQVIEFAHNRYVDNLNVIKDLYTNNIVQIMNNSSNSLSTLLDDGYELLKDIFETNSQYDQWFGDSTTYNEQTNIGIKNFIATLPYLKLVPRIRPYKIIDETKSLYAVVHHDGHRYNYYITPSRIDSLYKTMVRDGLITTQAVATDAVAFPTTISGNPPTSTNYLLRTVTSPSSKTLYKYNTTLLVWVEINLNELFCDIILKVEQDLYDNLTASSDLADFSPRFDLDETRSNDSYTSLLKTQFITYAKNNGLSHPLSTLETFRQNDPYTWNYYYSEIFNHPITSTSFNANQGSWQGLYTAVYNTPYPHLEPWALQFYTQKPLWWDAVYLNSDPFIDRRWKASMWDDILNGVIPVGYTDFDGNPGLGLPNQISARYSYVPVNISTSETNDGIPLDGLIPPYWNSNNSVDSRIRSLFDMNSSEFVVSPNLNFEFGHNGYEEWKWRTGSQKLYDDLIVSFRLQPLRFLHKTFDSELIKISCLDINPDTQRVPSHNTIKFHGEMNDDVIYYSNGLNQWYVHYNRYNNIDNYTSGFINVWKNWTSPLTYAFNSFIDIDNFLIFCEKFDITNKDYSIKTKITAAIDNKWLDELNVALLSIPSRFSKTRDNGIGWTMDVSTSSPQARELHYYKPQNFEFTFNSGVGTIESYNLFDASISFSHGYQIVNYNQSLLLSTSTNLLNDTTSYYVDVTIDGVATISIDVMGSAAQTVGTLINVLNDKLSGYGFVDLVNGNLVFYSNTIGLSSDMLIVDVDLLATVSSQFNGLIAPALSENTFNKAFTINGNVSEMFPIGNTFTITNSSYFNGEYTVNEILYDVKQAVTYLYVRESKLLPSYTDTIQIDGMVNAAIQRTLPDEWVTGTQVFLNSTMELPKELSMEVPYFIIRVSDTEFMLADTATKANVGTVYPFTGTGVGQHSVGVIQKTFTALGGSVPYVWRKHAYDTRTTYTTVDNYTISGMQNLIDFVFGYEAYNTAQGFLHKNVNGENVDADTGRTNDWLFELEKFIDWAYKLRASQQEDYLEYNVEASLSTQSFNFRSGHSVNWANGTAVILTSDSDELPDAFNSMYSSISPYYVIKEYNSTNFKLAYTFSDAKRGVGIPFSTIGSNLKVKIYKKINRFPTYTLNPFKTCVWVENSLGVLSNVFFGKDNDILTTQKIYDVNGDELTAQELFVLRKDKESFISRTGKSKEQNGRPISGMHLFYDGYEHVLQFNNYSVTDSLIYDPFLGLRTPRFFLQFNKQKEKTLRPNVGGYYFKDNKLEQNIESAVNDLRYLYDSSIATEGRKTTDLVRKSLGYTGTKDYMDDLYINPKTQFLFWKGMIQNKGTNFALDAFTNQKIYEQAEVDEFWAYKLAEFGDSDELSYPEMKMFPRDVVRDEMRIEFTTPDLGVLDETFEPVALTDTTRWWNQPDQLALFGTQKTFYFNVKISAIVENAWNQIQYINSMYIIKLPTISDGVIITYKDGDQIKSLIKEIDFKLLNSRVVQFTTDSDPRTLPELTVSCLTYDEDSQNVAKVIDKKSGTVITNVQFWNPVLNQHYQLAMSIVDIVNSDDPALYNTIIEESTGNNYYWSKEFVDTVWMNTYENGYLPYYDSGIYPDINDRIFLWGKQAEWADLSLLRWVESEKTPDEYDGDGTPIQKIYVNNGDELTGDIWTEIRATHVEFYVAEISPTTDSTIDGTVKAYVNGKYHSDVDVSEPYDFWAFAQQFNLVDVIHLIKVVHTPTEDELDNNQYRYYTPYSTVTKLNVNTKESYNLYYFWVNDSKIKINKEQITISPFEAKRQLVTMPKPYMILQGLLSGDAGYGLIYGNVFDGDDYGLPYRYTQLVVRGLEGTVKDENRYTMRFTRDFCLRDSLDNNSRLNSLEHKNKHVEWKLIRQKQLTKIDRYLWEKLKEALVGFRIVNNVADTETQIPTLNRVLYDLMYNTDTQYGMSNEQAFVNKPLAKTTILSHLSNPNNEFKFVDIQEFLELYDFNTSENIILAMDTIYDTFDIQEINDIFFETLHDAFSTKYEYPDFFKTSWVAIQITQNVSLTNDITVVDLGLQNDGLCEDIVFVEPTLTPLPSPSVTPTPTVTPTTTTTPQQ